MTGDDMPGMSHAMGGMKMYVHGGIGGDSEFAQPLRRDASTLTQVLWFASWQPSSAGATVGVCIGLFLFAILDRYLHAVWRACAASWARGAVGFTLPVTRGDLPPPSTSAPISSPSSSAIAVAALALDPLDQPLRRRDPSAVPQPASCCADEKAALADSLAQANACDCGCGGECGSSSSPAGCCGTGNCVPDYRESTPRETPREKSQVSLAYLPPTVRRTLDPARAGRWSRPFRLAADVPRGLLYMLLSFIHFALMLVVMTFQLWWIISVVVGLGVGEGLFGRFGAGLV